MLCKIHQNFLTLRLLLVSGSASILCQLSREFGTQELIGLQLIYK
jgi:hypothetical protein